MMRSLWTAASGMTGQQYNIDTIANNLSNVNTTGFQTEPDRFRGSSLPDIQTGGNSGYRN